MADIFSSEVQQAIWREAANLAKGGEVTREIYQKAVRNVAGGNPLSRIANIGNLLGNLPGDLLRDIKSTAILALIGVEGENVIQRAITEKRLDLNPVPQWLEPIVGGFVRGGSEAVGAPLFDLLIKEPLGLNLDATPGAEGSEAVRALQRLFGFGVMLDFGTSELHDLLKTTMGANAPTGLLDAVKNIPQSVGVNWAVGFLLSQFVWTAYMPPLVERANRSTRPARLSPDALITLEQRGIISPAEASDGMANAGYRDADMDHMRELARTRLTVSDLQQAFLFELRDQSFVHEYLIKSGASEADADLLVQLYLEKAETAGGDQLRAVAQRGFMDNHLTEGEYYEILRSVNVPTASANLEVDAAKLAKTWQVKTLSVAQVKTLFDKNLINDAQAIARLVGFGYSEDDALGLVKSWHETATMPHPGLTETMILNYLASGVLTSEEAYDRLIDLNIKPEDASFLVRHPSTAGPIKSHGASQATIVSAYKDGVIDVTEARQKLAEQALSTDAIDVVLREATFQVVRGKTPKAPHQNLTTAQVLDAFRYGLATSAWAVRQLSTNGYTEADATLIVAIEQTKLSGDGSPPDGWATLN